MLLLFKKEEHPVNNFTIYGERHSGTNLLESITKESLGLAVTWDFGWKHFFGFVKYQQIVQSKNTLFFAIVRNPYDWIIAMYSKQYHIPKENERPFNQFLLNEWFSIDDYGKEIKNDRHYLLGRKYKNLFEMRKAKLQYIMNYMPKLCNNLCVTTYEHITDRPSCFAKTVSKYFGLNYNDSKMPIIWNRKQYEVPREIKPIIDSNLDWDTEHYFGYSLAK